MVNRINYSFFLVSFYKYMNSVEYPFNWYRFVLLLFWIFEIVKYTYPRAILVKEDLIILNEILLSDPDLII